MPTKGKPRKGDTAFTTRGVPLSEQAKATLAGAIGIPPEPAWVGRVEVALGFYVDGNELVDNLPRASDFVAMFSTIEEQSRALLKTLTEDAGRSYLDQFEAADFDIDDFIAALGGAYEIAVKKKAQFKGEKAAGARKSTAKMETIRRLRKVFRDFYAGPRGQRKSQGAFVFQSEQEQREVRFVLTALSDARVVPVSYDEKMLQRDFRDPRCSLIEDRHKVIERIAKKRTRGENKNPPDLP